MMNSTTVETSPRNPEAGVFLVFLQFVFLGLGHLVSAGTTLAIIYAIWKEAKFASIGSFNLINLMIAWMLNMIMLNVEITLDTYGESMDGIFLCYIHPMLVRIPVTAEAFFLCYICTERSWHWKSWERTDSIMLVDGAQAWSFVMLVEAYWFVCAGREWLPLYKENAFKCYVIMDDYKKLQSFFMGLYVCLRSLVPGAIYFAHYKRLKMDIFSLDSEPRLNLAVSPAELEQDCEELKSELRYMGITCASRLGMDMFDGMMLVCRSIFPWYARQVVETLEICLKYVSFIRCSFLPIGMVLTNIELRKRFKKIYKSHPCFCNVRSTEVESLDVVSGSDFGRETVELEEVCKGNSLHELEEAEGSEKVKHSGGSDQQSCSQASVTKGGASADENPDVRSELSTLKVTELGISVDDSEESSLKSIDNAQKWADAWNPVPPEENARQEETMDLDCESIVETLSELYGYVRVPRIVVTPSPPVSEVSAGNARKKKFVPMYASEREAKSWVDESSSLADSENDSTISMGSVCRSRFTASTSDTSGHVHFSYSGASRQLPLIPRTVPFEIPGSSKKRDTRVVVPKPLQGSSRSQPPFSGYYSEQEQGRKKRYLPEIPLVTPQRIERKSDMGNMHRERFVIPSAPTGGMRSEIGRKRLLPTTPIDVVDARLRALSAARSAAQVVGEKVMGHWV